MSVIAAIMLGVALAADAFAVSVVCGSDSRSGKQTAAFLTAGIFGSFQMLMPVLGWSIGKVGSSIISGYENIVGCIILVFLGIKMLADSRDKFYTVHRNGSQLRFLLLMAVATSIDALTAGIALPATTGAVTFPQMVLSVIMIGAVTFLLSLVGYYSGRRLRKADPVKVQIFGGFVLIVLGIKSLL